MNIIDDQNPALGHNVETASLDEMQTALEDETVSINFRKFAEKALVVENVDFLLDVINFKKVNMLNVLDVDQCVG